MTVGSVAEVSRSLEKGETLYHEGDLVTHLYTVERGALKIVKLGPGGRRELTLRVAGEGDVLGEAELFGGAEFFETSAVALEHVRVRLVPAEAAGPGSPPAVRLARRELELSRQLARLALLDLGARLAAHLLDETRGDVAYKLPANSELAASLGTVPELVSRKLGEFYRAGLIGLSKRELRVLNEAGLRRVAAR